MDGMLSRDPAVEAAEAPENKRREARKAFLKRAQVLFEGAGFYCVVENMSKAGARVRFGAPVALPEVFALRFHDGASYSARRCWSRGEVVGLEFSGESPAAEAERRHLLGAVQDVVTAADPAEAVRMLRCVWFFGDENLRRAAEALEVARARFVGALEPHVTGQSAPPLNDAS